MDLAWRDSGGPRQIPRPAGENAGHRDDAVKGSSRGQGIRTSLRMTGVEISSVLCKLFHCPEQILGLRKDGVFQDRLVGDKGVFSGDAAHGSVEVIE